MQNTANIKAFVIQGYSCEARDEVETETRSKPIISDTLGEIFLNDSPQKKVKRSTFPNQGTSQPSIEPDFEQLKSELGKNVQVTTLMPEKKNIDPLKYDLSIETCETLKKIVQSTHSGKDLCFLTNIVFYLSKQITIIVKNKEIQTLLENKNQSLIEIQSMICSTSYLLLTQIGRSTFENHISLNLFYLIKNISSSSKEFKKLIESLEFEKVYFERLNQSKKNLDIFKRTVLHGLNEIEATLSSLSEISNINTNMNPYLGFESIKNIINWDCNDCNSKPIENTFTKELLFFKQTVIDIYKFAYEKRIDLTYLRDKLNTTHVIQFDVSFPPQKRTVFYGIHFEQDIATCLNSFIKIFEKKDVKVENVLERFSSLTQIQCMYTSSYNLVEAALAGLTHKAYLRQLNVQRKPDQFFLDNTMNSCLFNSAFMKCIESIKTAVEAELNKRNVFINFSEKAFIELLITAKKIEICLEETSPIEIELLLQEFSKELKSSKLLSNEDLKKIGDFLNSINKLGEYLRFLSIGLKTLLSHFRKNGLTVTEWNLQKPTFKELRQHTSNFEKLMIQSNTILQNIIDKHKDSDIGKIQSLKSILLSFKNESSKFLAPLSNVISTYDKLYYCSINAHDTNNELEIDVCLDDDSIEQFFNINFEEIPKVIPVQITEAPVPVLPPKQTIAHKQNTSTPPPIKTSISQIKQKPVIEKNNDAGPMSIRTKEILAYLAENGWVATSITGSHLKLRKSNESLIVPINKNQLPKGTAGAIYREKREKEDKIALRNERK